VVICPHQANFWAPLPGKKKTSARGVSHAHPLLCFSLALFYFYLQRFYQKYKKIHFLLVVIFTCLLLALLEWVLMRTLSCVILLALVIVILSALLLRHLLLLPIFMRLNLLY
jgi:asparagine N-glycosylation enzyme membrane subunit Stt3